MTRESVLIKEAWMKQGINPLRCDAMMPNQAACCPFNRNKTSAVDPGRQFMRLVIKNDGMCSVGSTEVNKIDHSRYHRSKKKKLTKEPEHMFEMSKQSRDLKENQGNLEYNRKSSDMNLLSGSEPRNQAYNPSDNPRKFQLRNIESLLQQYNNAPSSPEYDKQESIREQISSLYDTWVRIADGFRPDEIRKCGDETRDREQKSKRKEHNNAEKIRRIQQAKSFKDLSCLIPDFYNSGKERDFQDKNPDSSKEALSCSSTHSPGCRIRTEIRTKKELGSPGN
ncbi:uncharacterized protein LOC111695943 isoform X3 [Eurytemora carolleeae]|uniref:uncharacterized protein LOC111695943 isoform X3 n=1 Tax=Eurytemora carolleeae TaxID=1294199 RepID=UPI000C77D621|nr:uncharacterized protein LOC111695943 isoform X3 [Eurytemora carolleeae]|eukprot:XP_023321219.1 uncharacterized protein LOC111695943 isoform X3 [Eurytemora affinis]